MSDKSNESATSRVPVKPSTLRRLRDFSHGLGVTHDEAIDLLLDLAVQEGEEEFMAGRRLRSKAEDDESDEPPSDVLTPVGAAHKLAAAAAALPTDQRRTFTPWPKERATGKR